ncbi:MAG: hypothetical protein C4554_09245 [Dethiobacter sp.]|nr:MAG: hypothetical protein C4554_09245 [Dethiobacter sp.]
MALLGPPQGCCRNSKQHNVNGFYPEKPTHREARLLRKRSCLQASAFASGVRFRAVPAPGSH